MLGRPWPHPPLPQERNLLNAPSMDAAGRLQPPTSERSTSGRTQGSGRTTAPSPAADVPSPVPQTTKTTWGYTRVRMNLWLFRSDVFAALASEPEPRRRLSSQVRSRTCAQCLAARSASQNTPAFTSTTWSTRPASPITATTVGKPTSRSQPSPCTNAPPTTTPSPSRRSRRPTSNPPPVRAWWRAMLSVI